MLYHEHFLSDFTIMSPTKIFTRYKLYKWFLKREVKYISTSCRYLQINKRNVGKLFSEYSEFIFGRIVSVTKVCLFPSIIPLFWVRRTSNYNIFTSYICQQFPTESIHDACEICNIPGVGNHTISGCKAPTSGTTLQLFDVVMPLVDALTQRGHKVNVTKRTVC